MNNPIQNYYEILGVSKTATREEIKRAFRQLSLAYHPDRPGGNEEKFKVINEAYTTLSDPDKRNLYDLLISGVRPPPLNPVCQSCHKRRITMPLAFRQIIGMIINHNEEKVVGNICAECSDALFWRYTAITLFLGWWGITSFFLTPIILAKNIWNYSASTELRQVSVYVSPDRIWRYFTVAGVMLIAIFLCGIYNAIIPDVQATVESNTGEIATPTQLIATITPVNAVLVPPVPSPTDKTCYQWNEITTQLQGNFLCAYGVVSSAYMDEANVFHMTFSSNPESFELILTGGNIYEGIQGRCVSAFGIVNTINGKPVIAVEDLYNCSQ